MKRVDWKTHYRQELTAPEARESLTAWLSAPPDDRLLDAVKRGAVVSFPHTRLAAAGPIDASIVSSLYAANVERIVALGVLHSGGCPPYRVALDETAPMSERASAFEVVRGGFAIEATRFETPFGPQQLEHPSEVEGVLRIDRGGRLQGEFSLDTFLSVLRLGADTFGAEPIPVEAVFVGMTRNPVSGRFDLARELAAWLRGRVSASTAVVATGDLVHFGTAYGMPDPIRIAGDLSRVLRFEVEETLTLALHRGEHETAYRRSKEVLMNDQREILPVIGEAVGVPGSFEIVRFELTDYASILDVADPCVVASALVVYG